LRDAGGSRCRSVSPPARGTNGSQTSTGTEQRRAYAATDLEGGVPGSDVLVVGEGNSAGQAQSPRSRVPGSIASAVRPRAPASHYLIGGSMPTAHHLAREHRGAGVTAPTTQRHGREHGVCTNRDLRMGLFCFIGADPPGGSARSH
jgi:hypothetical protein